MVSTSQPNGRVPLRGSERHPIAGAHSLGPVPSEERFELTVRVCRRAPLSSLPAARTTHADTRPAQRHYLTREAYAQQHGADPADLMRVADFARKHGLVVIDASVPRRSVFLSGTASQVAAAFGTSIEHYEYDGGSYRGRTGPLHVPADLQDLIEGVFGIDDRPVARPHFQRGEAQGLRAMAAGTSFTPPQLAQLYGFPADADGSGQCIGLIELDGGYRKTDIAAYFERLGLAKPTVRSVRVDGARNHPTNAESADGEVMLDIEVAAAVAPQATIVVYFAPNTDKGFLDAITLALHDTTHKPSALSISWGNPEKNWTAQAMRSYDQAFQTAGLLGVTVCCAAGDAGSGDENPDQLAQEGRQPDGLAHVDFPASSPHVLACGGTRLTTAGGAIKSEAVWDDDSLRSATGGGISDFFDVPDYQARTEVPASANPGHRRGRGVPDVAGDASPASGYQVRVDGQDLVFGGTSAVAPLWAGLVALLNQKLGHPVGWLNPLLYGSLKGHGVTRDITHGSNDAYKARKGWDPCTGWGSPHGEALLKALAPRAGASPHGAAAARP
jgi:kumamolisin